MNLKISRIIVDPALVNKVVVSGIALNDTSPRNMIHYFDHFVWASRSDLNGPSTTVFDLQTGLSKPKRLRGIFRHIRACPPYPVIFLR